MGERMEINEYYSHSLPEVARKWPGSGPEGYYLGLEGYYLVVLFQAASRLRLGLVVITTL